MLFRFESRSRTLLAHGRQFPKVEICSKVCMNETYPNISERRAVFFGHSAGRVAATRGGQTRGKSAREHVRERARERIDRRRPCRVASPVRAGSLERACVRTVCNCHSPRGTPRVCDAPGRYSRPSLRPCAQQNVGDEDAEEPDNFSRR